VRDLIALVSFSCLWQIFRICWYPTRILASFLSFFRHTNWLPRSLSSRSSTCVNFVKARRLVSTPTKLCNRAYSCQHLGNLGSVCFTYIKTVALLHFCHTNLVSTSFTALSLLVASLPVYQTGQSAAPQHSVKGFHAIN